MNIQGVCECGCGGMTNIATQNHSSSNILKGEHFRFINKHQYKKGEKSCLWKGGRTIRQGYVLIKQPEHPDANPSGYILEHRIIAESVLKKFLPNHAIVHHVNEIRNDNSNKNLVICENETYHKLLHRRMRSLSACGNPHYRKCNICKEYDDMKNLAKHDSSLYHSACHAKRNMEKYYKNKGYDPEQRRSSLGGSYYQASLSNNDVAIIKNILNGNSFKNIEIARIFEVSPDIISKIKNNASWKHIKQFSDD